MSGSDQQQDTVAIDMRGHKQGPFQIGKHVMPGPQWVWYDGDRFLWWTASRWRWLCIRRFYGKRNASKRMVES